MPDRRTLFGNQWDEVAIKARSRAAELGDPGRLVRREPESPQTDNQTKVGHIGLGVLAIAIRLSSRGGQRADRLVPTDCRGGDAGASRELRNLHVATVHLEVT